MLVARRADELRGRRVVCAAAHPLHRQTRAGDDAGGDLGELTELSADSVLADTMRSVAGS